MAFPSDGGNGPKYVSIGQVSKTWVELIPDTYWETEHLLGREVELTIVDVMLEQYPDSLPRAVMKFLEDQKLLRLAKFLRTTLKEFFGDTPSACIGKRIRLTAGQNQMRQIVIKILPATQVMQQQANQPAPAYQGPWTPGPAGLIAPPHNPWGPTQGAWVPPVQPPYFMPPQQQQPAQGSWVPPMPTQQQPQGVTWPPVQQQPTQP